MIRKFLFGFAVLALVACAEAEDPVAGDSGAGGAGAAGGFGGGGGAGGGFGGAGGGGGGNQRPELKRIGDREAPVGVALEIQLEATDPEGSPLSFNIRSDLPEGAKFEKPTGLFTWTPTPDQEGNIKLLTFEVSDGELKDQETIQVTVIPADQAGNRPPVLEVIGDQVVTAGRPFSLQIVATDPNGDVLTYSLRGNVPMGATLDAGSGLFSWTPDAALAGQSFDVTFVAADAELEASLDVKLVVRGGDQPGNLPPRIRPIDDQQVQVGVEFRLVIEAEDDNPESLIFGLAGPAPGGAGFDAQSRTFFWTPLPDQANQAIPVVFQVSDGEFRAVERVTFQVVGEGPGPDNCTPDPEGDGPLVVRNGDNLARSICPAGQLDTYVISLQAGERLTVIAAFEHRVCDIDFDIYGPGGGAPIARAQGTQDLEEATVTAAVGGEHEVVVGCLDPAVTLDYEIIFEVGGGGPGQCIEDDFEAAGGDALNDAQPLPEDVPLQICAGDADFWSFQAQAGSQITVDVLFSHAAGDIDVRLFGPDGVAVGQSQGSADNEQVRVVAPATGRYVLEVIGYMGAENSYRLALDVQAPVACAADRVEPNDTLANAEPFRPENYNSLTQCGDPDWFKTEVQDGQTLQVFISYTSDAPDVSAYTQGGAAVPGQSFSVAMGDGCRAARAGCRLMTAPAPNGGGFLYYLVEAGTLGQTYDLTVRVVAGAQAAGCNRAAQSCEDFEVCDYASGGCVDAFCDARGVGCPAGYDCHQEWCAEACVAGACAHPGLTCKRLGGEALCGLAGDGPLGQACFDFTDCSRDFDCLLGVTVPGGYCTRQCARDADCGPGGACARFSDGNYCGKTCAANADCRAGYGCNAHPRAEGGGNVRMCTPGFEI